jgi:hypothetical protein
MKASATKTKPGKGKKTPTKIKSSNHKMQLHECS